MTGVRLLHAIGAPGVAESAPHAVVDLPLPCKARRTRFPALVYINATVMRKTVVASDLMPYLLRFSRQASLEIPLIVS